jgi:hypothetical protein
LDFPGIYEPLLGPPGKALNAAALHRTAESSVPRSVADVVEYLRQALAPGAANLSACLPQNARLSRLARRLRNLPAFSTRKTLNRFSAPSGHQSSGIAKHGFCGYGRAQNRRRHPEIHEEGDVETKVLIFHGRPRRHTVNYKLAYGLPFNLEVDAPYPGIYRAIGISNSFGNGRRPRGSQIGVH